MIKGITHRVIVVKSPDTRYFEEAIFVVRDDILRDKGADSAEILREARKIANSYISGSKGKPVKLRKTFNLPAPFFAAAGAAATGVAWLAASLCGI